MANLVARVQTGKHEAICINCLWFYRTTPHSPAQCRRNAPTSNYLDGFPSVYDHAWCGQFELNSPERYKLEHVKKRTTKVTNAKGPTKRKSSRRKEVGSV